VWPSVVWSQSITSPLPPGVQILRSQTVTIEAHAGAGGDIYSPGSERLIIDYAIEQGKKITIMVVTGEQYHQVSAGRKLIGNPLLKVVVSGVGTKTVGLQRGTYFITFLNEASTDTRIAWRASH